MGMLEGLTAELPTSVEDVRHFIDCIEQAVTESGAIVHVEPLHYFGHNAYAREMKLKSQTLVVGRIHKFPNINILSEGEASVFSIDGVMRIKAPHTFIGSKGSKRVIYAHTDLTWTTVIGTDSKDPHAIEDQFTCLKYEQLELT